MEMTVMNGGATGLALKMTQARIILQRIVGGDYAVLKDNTGALGSKVTAVTALALRNDALEDYPHKGTVLILPVEPQWKETVR
jgi:hypothetical protein